ncbi:MAG: N-acetylmuramidase [Gammaproteobacteria bacterium]|nr:N-acetylmuramidase [Gammaproteobacteria bacterium]
MADFGKAFEHTLKMEGGYVFDPDDLGGETYRGVSRRYFPKWEGWVMIDMAKNKGNFPNSLGANDPLQKAVEKFYHFNFWDRVMGDEIVDQDVAETIFDFAVNAGTKISAQLAQQVAEATADGVIGPKSVEKINAMDPAKFIAMFTVAKIARYVHICEQRNENRKYFFGWIKRSLEGV